MTTALLPPLLPGVSPFRLALVLERLEDERQQCGAVYCLLIDRAGQIIAADGFANPADATALALRLVPVFLASRSLSRTFREWPVRVELEDSGRQRLVTLPLLDQWLLAMAFGPGGPPTPPASLTERWMQRLAPLLPQRPPGGRPRQPAGTIVMRDGVNLLFRDDQEGE
jgi:hypothetical protein